MIYTSTHRFTRISFFLFWITLIVSPFSLVAQNPGGVTGDVLWYKANSGVSLVGGTVAIWNDSSASANNATQLTAVNQPAYNANSINFNEAVTFSGANYLTTPTNGLPSGTSARTVFVVATSANTQPGNSWVYGYGTASLGAAFNVGKVIGSTTLHVSGDTDESESTAGFWTANLPKLGRVTYSTPTVSFFDAGIPIGTGVQTGWNTVLAANSGRIGSYVNSTSDQWRGNIAEIIMYPGAITGNAAVSVESYLAIKYGIHKPGNYLNSAGTVVWDATANVLFDNDVFGIGQDDTSGLLQTQSNSVNTGSGDGTGQSGKGNITISNPSSLNNNGFLMIGRDVNLLAEIDELIGGNLVKRVQRTWKVQSAGNPGTVTLSYDISGLSYTATGANGYTLLVDTSGTGNFDGAAVVRYTATSLLGNKVSFDNVDLPTGSVFTFQTSEPPLLAGSSPTISSFTPQTGPVGTTVIITGANFGATIAENIVFFGGVQATVTAASTTSLTVTVPVSASYQPITVLNGTTLLIGNSSVPFLTTFSPNKGNITIDDLSPIVNIASTPGATYRVAIGDLDGDGKADLAVTSDSVVTIYRNISVSGTITSSSFAAGVSYTAGGSARGVVFGDLDADGKLDMVVSNFNGNTISYYRNTSTLGNISFSARTNLSSGANPIGLVVTDIDGDGKVDIAVTAYGGTTVSVYRNLTSTVGNISFSGLTSFSVGAAPYAMVCGDLDGDGKADLAVANNSGNSISILRNTSAIGSISFANQVVFPANLGPYSIAIGDVTKDGKNDLAVGYNGTGSNSISVFRNTSSGVGNISFDTKVDFVIGTNPRSEAIGDLDGDGNPDLVVSTGGSVLSVFHNTAVTSGPISFGPRVDFAANINTGSVAIGDLDGDGKYDVVTANSNASNIGIFRNNPLFAPTIQATNVTFTATTATATTATWTNGNGSSRAVFMYAGTSGSPVPVDFTPYTANAIFSTGAQIGTTGWFCVYYGTGTTVNITGLTPATDYRVMVVERNGSATDELYLSTVSTGNPVNITTLNNVATLSNLSISEGTLTPVFAAATTIYTAVVPNATTDLTVTPTTTDSNATVTVNGVVVTSGSPSGAIALTVGVNVITTIVTAQDGTTLGTYTTSVTRTAPSTIVTTGTLTALTSTYGSVSTAGVFNVSGTDMLDGILVTAPTGFEVSSDNVTFGNTTTIGALGVIVSTPVYIRLKGNIAAGDYSGDIVLTSNTATTVNVATILSTVNKAVLTVTADNQTKVYGAVNPALTVTYSGFANGDTVASLITAPTIVTTAVTGSPVGSYPITASGAVSSNYTFSYVAGSLNVTPVVLTVTADNQTKVYGDVNPALTVTYSGFANGDTVASLTTAPTITTTADTSSSVGSYPITASGAVSSNYTFSYVAGSLNVTPVVLTVTADNQTKVYGEVNPALTVTYSGFANGDTVASLTTAPTITTTADTSSSVGSYPITASGAVSSNYTFSYVAGSLTVTAATLTVTADNQTKVYGDVNPTLTVTYSGFANGDTVASLTTAPTIVTTAVTGSPVGSYPITASGAVSSNYTFSYVAGSLNVTPVVLTVTADNQTKVYGEVNPALTVTYSGFANGDTVASLTTAPTITTTADTSSSVGSYPITASGAVSSNYTFSYVAGSLNVTPVVLTVTADNQTKVYGAVNPALTVSYSGFANGDTVASLTTAPSITTTADTSSSVGSYPITASGAVSSNYTFSYVAGSLNVTPVVLTVTADNQTKVYGDVNPTLTVTYSGFANGDTVASLTTAPTIITTADTSSSVGSYPITASGAVSSNYTFSYVAGSLNVTPVVLTVTADNQTKVYGDVNPTLTVTYSGFANGDTVASLTTAPTIITTADATSSVGSYPITASGAVSSNYTFSYVAGSLSVTPVVLTVTADNQTKVYGDVNPTLTVTYSGFANGDTVTSLTTAPTIVTTAVTGSPVGSYPITASGAVSSNYTFAYVAGSLTVTAATLTVTADNQTKVYGAVNPVLTVTYSGFANGDTVASLTTAPSITTTADTSSSVGSYPITASGAVSSNYTFSYVAGSLNVTPVVLTVTADNQTKVYGEVNPALTVTYSGFANGDTVASLTTAPTITTTAVTGSPVGSYPITASGAVSSNYTFSYVAGSLSVTPVVLTVTADNQTKVYGDVNPTLTVTYSGFANGDTVASLTTAPTITTTAVTGSPVGSYPITASGAVSSNYTFNYVAGSLTVTAAILTVTADNQTKVYGDVNPTLMVTYSGFANGDTVASLTTAPGITTTADATSPVGSYPITASGAVDTNYTFSYVAGSLTVTKAILTITADNKTKDFGDVNPTLTATYSGFANGETETSLTTLATITTTAITASPVGNYPITASGAVAVNYSFNYVPGILEVLPLTNALLTNLSISQGTLTPVFAVTTKNYTATVANAITSITVTPVTQDADATVTVNGVTVISGNASGALALAVGTNTITTIVTAQDGITTETYTVVVTRTAPPTIVTTGTLSALTTTYGTASTSGTFNVSGSDMLAGILVTAPSGFEVSTDNSTFTNTVTVGALGIIASTPVYIRLKGNIAAGSYSGDIVLTSNSALTVNVATISSTVSPATLTVTADNKTKVYGDANPTLTVSYAGFVNGDTVTSLTTAPSVSTTALVVSGVGSYPITATGAVNPNYAFTYVNGNLSINTANLTVTADDQTKTYGSANPTFTVAYSGFVNGDTEAVLLIPATVTTTADTSSPVGVYPLTVSGATAVNYTMSYTTGATLTITTAALTITADDQTKTYGSANPTLTASYTGFVNGDTAASLDTPATISTVAVTGSPVGSYPIVASGALDSNYTITFVNGNLAVTTATLTITADDKSKTYGSANPALTASYTGFVNGDTAASLDTSVTINTVAVTGSPVGSYPIVASGALDSNYTITFVNGNLAVTTATLTITADDKSKTYGSANPALTASYTGFVNGDTAASLDTPATISTVAITGSPVGSYPIVASGALDSNYTITFVNGNLAVTTAALTITADDKSKTYGSANPTLTASYTGFVNGDTAASLYTPATISTIANNASPVGSYPIVANGALDSNYTITFVNGNLSVTTATLTITADDQTKTYGSANPTLTASYTGFVNGDTATSLDTPATISTIAVTGSAVGSYPIMASGALDSNYTITFVNGNLAVTTATLTITADDQTKTYGSANPVLTASYTGFVNGDTAASLDTPATISTVAVTGSPVGSYPIVASGALDSNYTITFVNGNLAVTTATLTITADDKSKTYGSANPALTASYTGFVNGDTAASLDTPAAISTVAVTGSPVGSYPIVASGALDSNYTITFVNGNLAVTTATLTITADDKSKTYGSANPALTASYTGFVNGDTAASLDTPAAISTIAVTTSPVGTYPIVASGALDSNYTITFVNGNLAVTTATLTITADDQTKTYGSANPALTASYTGFVNGDTATSLDTPATLSTIANNASPVGSYPIVASGALDSNYTITFVNGNLAVTTATLTITADDQTKTYGSANPTLTASYTGFANGDTAASLDIPATISTVAVTGSPVGSYPIVASGALDSNYTITFVNGNLSVTTATLTITADDKSKTYGSANPTLTSSYAGFVNGDTAASLDTPATLSTVAIIGSPVGSYPIVASGALDSNYTITFVNGNLAVTTATLTITADDKSKTYGYANPTLTASYTGFVNGDTAASLDTPVTINTVAVTGSPVGSYPIVASGALDSNYTITFVNGNLAVTTATLTITADDKTKTYGSVNPTLTASYTGFVNGDTAASLDTPATISTIAVTTSPVGTYPIVASGALDSNYTITFVNGNLAVTTATLTITADDQTKTYGSANPVLTASYTGFVNGDTAASLDTPATLSTIANNASPVGSYPIVASGALDSNYTITFVNGNLAVTTATLTITADDQTKTYGSANPTLTASYNGFVNGDTAASLDTPAALSTVAIMGSPVGSYPIVASGALDSNYTITFVNGNLSVTTATLTITADDKTKTYGSVNPTLTASYSGFVNGDTAASLDTPATISTIAVTTSPVGTYPIVASGALDLNYVINYVPGVLTVTSSASNVNLASLTINSGLLNPAFSPNTLLYNVNVGNDIDTETITVSSEDPLATIKINGITIVNGGSLTPISLITGINKMVVTVTSPDGLVTKTYILNIIKEASDIATLSNLTISNGVLEPVFKSDVTSYDAAVKYDVKSITVTPIVTDLNSHITVNGVAVANATASTPIILNAGENIITTVVTAEDGITTETYTITIYKAVGPDKVVANNILSPNGDGKNDFWEIKDILLYPNNTVTVYDRAGRIVYSKKSYANEWGGIFDGSPLNNDTYYYLIDLGDALPKIKGFITIIRD
ncbi:gliding motility-associated-like protein [Flavobacterium sp. 90]|uniref:MBG domain-containing protein n=1 Tax=unclassified Flavobacterium TaxID=196869 RepID=UPI000EB402D2|nr:MULTISPECIES: MBG domain-containing protein [unclassified Flavobacterium]RKR04803.1 gliding motility-associated-like protein [Flavobacterium sp. 81]TCK56124.1 gliding motility-associated-like protein [Flavobacterium sp. 90]